MGRVISSVSSVKTRTLKRQVHFIQKSDSSQKKMPTQLFCHKPPRRNTKYDKYRQEATITCSLLTKAHPSLLWGFTNRKTSARNQTTIL